MVDDQLVGRGISDPRVLGAMRRVPREHFVPDGMRGRVMGVYAFCFIGLSPFGHFLAGWLAKVISAPFAVSLGSMVGVVALFLARNLSSASKRGVASKP